MWVLTSSVTVRTLRREMWVNVSTHIYPVLAYEIIASPCFDSTWCASLDYVIMSTWLLLSTQMSMGMLTWALKQKQNQEYAMSKWQAFGVNWMGRKIGKFSEKIGIMYEQWKDSDTQIKWRKIWKYICIDLLHICIYAYMPQQNVAQK